MKDINLEEGKLMNIMTYKITEFNDYPQNTLFAKEKEKNVEERIRKINKHTNKENMNCLKQIVKKNSQLLK